MAASATALPLIASGIATTPEGSAITPQKSAMTPRPTGNARDRRYRRERDSILNSVLNGDCSNSVPLRQIPEGYYDIVVSNGECSSVC